MGFSGVCRAVYDYTPQAEGELNLNDGDLLYVLDRNGGDGWWKAKKKARADEEDEPVGLIPNNYVEEAPTLGQARALYEYTRQTDEELSFPEDAVLDVFDISDPDWILVGLDKEYGFVPSNYIEMHDGHQASAPATEPASAPAPMPAPTPARAPVPAPAPVPAAPAPPSLPTRPQPEDVPEPESPEPEAPPTANPAAALAGVMHARAAAAVPPPPRSASPPPPQQPMRRPISQYHDPDVPEEDPVRSPTLPSRPRPTRQPSTDDYGNPIQRAESPRSGVPRNVGGFHMYNINEMISVMGKRKKMPTTLGINLATGKILIAPERASDGPSQEWTANRMTHYSREGKHVFMELVQPSKSVDFHAGAKDTAEEIVNALGELAGAVRAEGLREVIMAGTRRSTAKKGQVLYDFMAQGDDEVTVAIGDEVIIIDDTKSEEWWQVRRVKNGKQGVVPSSYVEITGRVTPPPESSEFAAVKSAVEQNRLEEIRLTKEAIKAGKEQEQVGPGMPLPTRGSSLTARENGSNSGQQRSRRENGRSESQPKSKSKPDPSKVRAWTDRSKSFSVEAQFLGLKDGKIHLHKMNGVKIAVPITKMSREDLEYVEDLTGISLEDDKPLADVKRERSRPSPTKKAADAGASVEKKPDYDWFQFFLSCDVAVGLCERYTQAFVKDSMDESVLPDVDATILRNLGLREGDIIKVMRAIDAKYGRNKRNASEGGDGDGGSGGLFSGPGGTLRNNTRKGRPALAVQTSDVVDPGAFAKKDTSSPDGASAKSPIASSPANGQKASGFDDDAWDVKPTKQQPPVESRSKSPVEPVKSASPPPQALTGSMKELSLLSAPLEPSRKEEPPKNELVLGQPTRTPTAPQQMPGATPGFFSNVRQRPTPPQTTGVQGSLVPPPPQRPLSAPQSAQPSVFAPPPMMPQMTGTLQGQPALPGQSLNDITQARLQQQYAAQFQAQQLQPTMTGYPGPMMPYPTGNPGQFMQPMMTGASGPSPFADSNRVSQFMPMQAQPTGFQNAFPTGQPAFSQPPPGGINNYLPPPLEPQRTGISTIQPQQTGMNSQMPQQPLQPLQPQQTGPPPPVRFGVNNDANKLAPQPTGRRANLSQATPQNPFGF